MANNFSSNSKYRFLSMIILAILITSGLVTISMTLYNNSGTAQLDLSRPGYKSVRAQVVNNNLQTYPNTGPITLNVITDFESIFDQESKKIESVDAFGSDPLSNYFS